MPKPAKINIFSGDFVLNCSIVRFTSPAGVHTYLGSLVLSSTKISASPKVDRLALPVGCFLRETPLAGMVRPYVHKILVVIEPLLIDEAQALASTGINTHCAQGGDRPSLHSVLRTPSDAFWAGTSAFLLRGAFHARAKKKGPPGGSWFPPSKIPLLTTQPLETVHAK